MRLQIFTPDNCNMHGKIQWTEAMETLLSENYTVKTNRELARALGLHLTVVRMKLYEMGLKRMEMEYWTDEQIEFLKENYKTIGDTELAPIFQERWPKKKKWTKKHIDKKRKYLNLVRTPEEIKKILERYVKAGRYADSNLKKWRKAHDAEKGTIKIWTYTDGRKFKVIKTEKGYVHYAPWLWKQHNGEVPAGHVVGFKDYNSMNVTIENLQLFTRAEHAIRNRADFRYPELKETIALQKQLLKKIKQKEDARKK